MSVENTMFNRKDKNKIIEVTLKKVKTFLYPYRHMAFGGFKKN
jgi:hypothetical protein